MKKKLDLSFVGKGTIASYGTYLYENEDGGKALESIIHDALAESSEEDYFGRMDVTVHIELPADPGLKVVAE